MVTRTEVETGGVVLVGCRVGSFLGFVTLNVTREN